MFPLNVYVMTDFVYLPLFHVSFKCTHYDVFVYLPLFFLVLKFGKDPFIGFGRVGGMADRHKHRHPYSIIIQMNPETHKSTLLCGTYIITFI